MQKLTTAENLASSAAIYFFHQDQRGQIWISSNSGTNVFDGQRVSTQQLNSESGFSQTGRFLEDKTGRIRFSTSKGWLEYIPTADSLRQIPLRDLPVHIGATQLLWWDQEKSEMVGRNGNQIFRVLEKKGNRIAQIDTFPLTHSSTIIPIGEQLLIVSIKDHEIHWGILTSAGISDRKFIKLGQWFPTAFAVDHHRNLWIGSDEGLWAVNLDLAKIEKWGADSSLQKSEITAIQLLPNEQIMVGTKGQGLFLISPEDDYAVEIWYRIGGESQPFRSPIETIYLDETQNLWLALPGKGVFHTNLQKVQFFPKKVGQRGQSFSSMVSVAQAPDGALSILGPVAIANLKTRDLEEKGAQSVTSLLADRQTSFHHGYDSKGNLWLATSGGLYPVPNLASSPSFRLAKTNSILESKEDGTFIFPLSNGATLIGTRSSGVREILWTGKRATTVPLPLPQISKGLYEFIYENERKQIFAIKYLSKIDILHLGKGGYEYLDSVLIPSLNVNGLASSPTQDTTWLATTQGLWYIVEKDGTFQKYQVESFPFEILKGILAEEDGTLWISSNQGLIRYWPNKPGMEYRRYGLADGIQELEYQHHAFLQLQDGRFAFGGGGGLDIFDPKDIKDLDIEARPTITEVMVNDEPAPFLRCEKSGAKNPAFFERLVLDHEYNTLSFSFAAMDYSDPESNRFGYDLREKGDPAGKRVESDFARFANLSPGEYEFELFATNSEGRWAEESKVLEIVIEPPFWKTWWFGLLMTLLILGIISLVFYLRVREIRKNAEMEKQESRIKQQEAEIKQREAEAKKRKAEFNRQLAEMETSILRLQMNPHFLFNSLNSIRNHILEQNYDTANKYLTKFSKLMRRVLNLAAEELISLEEEEEILRNYVEVEQIRFPDRFKFSFEIADGLDSSEIMVPSMLFQPFVENAILHAFPQEITSGVILVQVHEKEHSLVIRIRDNGIGRKRAAEHKVNKEHESKATQITKERLDLLSQKYQQQTALDIRDLVDETGKGTGTEVELLLPKVIQE